MNTYSLLEQYKEKHNFRFDTFFSTRKGFHLRFELGGKLENGTDERIKQAKFRANKIFNSIIPEGNLCFFEIYDFPNNFFDKDNKFKEYLYNILDLKSRKIFHGPFEQLYSEIDEKGEEIIKVFEEELDCDLILGVDEISDSKISKIIEGIVNLEMGKSPIITQDIYIYDVTENVGFRIYDDRGCHIWSSEKNKLKEVYQKFKNWIVDNEKTQCEKIYD